MAKKKQKEAKPNNQPNLNHKEDFYFHTSIGISEYLI